METSDSSAGLGLDSIIIATDQPAAMADWYANVLGADRQSDNVVQSAELQLVLFPHDQVSGLAPQPERVMVNFRVEDVGAFTKRVDALGVAWKRPFGPVALGEMATLIDPDGNFVQFVKRSEVDVGSGNAE